MLLWWHNLLSNNACHVVLWWEREKNLRLQKQADVNTGLLFLGLLCHMLPLMFWHSMSSSTETDDQILQLSRVCSIMMPLSYIAFLFFQLKTHQEFFEEKEVNFIIRILNTWHWFVSVHHHHDVLEALFFFSIQHYSQSCLVALIKKKSTIHYVWKVMMAWLGKWIGMAMSRVDFQFGVTQSLRRLKPASLCP